MGLIMSKGTFKIISYRLMAIFFYLSYLFPINSRKILLIMTHDESEDGNVGSIASYFHEKDKDLIFKAVTRENYNFHKNKYLLKNLFFMFIILPFHLATSRIIFMDNVFLPFSAIKIKKDTNLVQLWHGTGSIKKFGLDTEEGWIREKAIKVNKNTSHFIVGSQWMKNIYETAFGADKHRIFNTGCPRTDLFFHENQIHERKKGFLKEYPELANKTIILYAPTFRDDENVQEIKLNLDIDELISNLDDNFVLGLRLHPNIADKVDLDKICSPRANKNRIFDFSHYEKINTLLISCDILITDYSSIIYEYALLKKPMIFYSHDLEKFEKSGRGFYGNYKSMVPGPVVFKTKDVVDEINNLKEYNLDEFLAVYLENCDGNARKRIYDLLDPK